MKEYLESTQRVLEHVDSTSTGLTGKEAQTRLEQQGKNKLQEAKGKSLAKRFLEQILDPMILILLAAATISGVTAVMEGESFADVFIIYLWLL